jgi:WD40 repeat protein
MKVTRLYEGHFDEITKLAVIGNTMISASLDGTIRTWDTRIAPPKLDLPPLEEELHPAGGLTADEERELAELMSDED